jgi:2-keto-4-pentenoate hydratase/2-oxohepta-3-ene-1,7-dioic acid hydratase in catechol pathway
MARWMKFRRPDACDQPALFGRLDGDWLDVYAGDLFASPKPTGERVAIDQVVCLPPCAPGKFIGLWNNFRAAAEKAGNAIPAEPLYFIKPATSYAGPGEEIRPPANYDGRVVFEGELGIVIGRRAHCVTPEEARACIFGYTVVNDVTALDLIGRDASFAQWTRAKGADGFGVFGPVIATDLDPQKLVVRSILNGRERQNYPVSDAIFAPHQVVSQLSFDMTLEPGDVIALGTSLGAAPMKPGATIEIVIDGIGALVNRFAEHQHTAETVQ